MINVRQMSEKQQNTIGNRIRECRKELNLSLNGLCDEISKEIGVIIDTASLSRIENAEKGRMKDETIEVIINFLREKCRVRYDWLYGFDDMKTGNDLEQHFAAISNRQLDIENKELLFLEVLGFKIRPVSFIELPPTNENLMQYGYLLTDNAKHALELCIENDLSIKGKSKQGYDTVNSIASKYNEDFAFITRHDDDIGYVITCFFRFDSLCYDNGEKQDRKSLNLKTRYFISYKGQQVGTWEKYACEDLIKSIKAACKATLDNYNFNEISNRDSMIKL